MYSLVNALTPNDINCIKADPPQDANQFVINVNKRDVGIASMYSTTRIADSTYKL